MKSGQWETDGWQRTTVSVPGAASAPQDHSGTCFPSAHLVALENDAAGARLQHLRCNSASGCKLTALMTQVVCQECFGGVDKNEQRSYIEEVYTQESSTGQVSSPRSAATQER
ncbi:uncharacterized protein LOC142579572 [Dermacentor variabilis]|uniref:uncharacterized protein LOC142579572 n=1 Tax=Dermacentor variabilis TaxID=34621 RepID=UPI003F5B30EA